MVLAMILGDKMEDAFRQSMLMSKGSMGIFYSNPLVGTITTLAFLLLLWPLVSLLLKKARASGTPASTRAAP
jgi:TctA family transporter